MSTCIAPGCAKPREIGSVFCGTHLAAPAGRRGGWISAERRRRLRGGDLSVSRLDASNICRRLWVGAKPPFDQPLPEFDVLFLCAQEIQPERLSFRGKVIRIPLPDGPLSPQELATALIGGQNVARALRAGKRVLVTCAMGLNRSALVAGLGLGLVAKCSADDVIRLMRTRRNPNCLFNEHFRQILRRYIGHGRARGQRQSLWEPSV